jgi:hypothetical protein
VWYRNIEIALILAGSALVFFTEGSAYLHGLGKALTIQSSLMLLLDYFAERRGAAYVQFLQQNDTQPV